MPPVIFLPLAGLVILLLAWQQAVAVLALPPGPVELPAGAVAAAGAFAFFAYGAKLVRRPGVLAEDLRILPGRAGIGAALVALSGLAAMLAGIAPGLARALLALGLVLHLAYGLVLIAAVMRQPGQGRISPLWQIDFAGPAAAALAAAILGWPGLARALLWFSLAAMLAIWAASAAQLWRERVGPPLRPLLALHALPPALAGMAAARLGMPGLALSAGAVSLVLLAATAFGARWLTATGFSPLWGALTLPLAAQAGLAVTLSAHVPAWRLPAIVLLVLATLAVLPVTFRIWRDWARGGLAVKTNAAIA